MFLINALTIFLIVLIAAIIILALMIIIFYISTKNKFIRMLEDIDNSASRIDVYLTKRYDDLTKMLASVKGYMKHENETLKEVTNMRTLNKNSSMKEKADYANKLNDVAREINLVVEQYPNLKADSVFIKLQDEIAEIEENLQAARSNYNSNVASYNKSISVFPNSLVAGNKFIKREYFEAEDIKREDVKIEF